MVSRSWRSGRVGEDGSGLRRGRLSDLEVGVGMGLSSDSVEMVIIFAFGLEVAGVKAFKWRRNKGCIYLCAIRSRGEI